MSAAAVKQFMQYIHDQVTEALDTGEEVSWGLMCNGKAIGLTFSPEVYDGIIALMQEELEHWTD